jgi:hypothetical protein
MPTVACPGISADIFLNCTKPISAGVRDTLYIFNLADLESVVENSTNPNIIEDIVLASGAFLYRVEGKNNSNEPRSALSKGTFSTAYDHEVIFKVFSVESDTKSQLQYMANTKLVAIVENNFKGVAGSVPYEIYGLTAGLELQALERILNDADTQGAYNLTLASSETIKEPTLPKTFFDTDYATTKALLEALFTV